MSPGFGGRSGDPAGEICRKPVRCPVFSDRSEIYRLVPASPAGYSIGRTGRETHQAPGACRAVGTRGRTARLPALRVNILPATSSPLPVTPMLDSWEIFVKQTSTIIGSACALLASLAIIGPGSQAQGAEVPTYLESIVGTQAASPA